MQFFTDLLLLCHWMPRLLNPSSQLVFLMATSSGDNLCQSYGWSLPWTCHHLPLNLRMSCIMWAAYVLMSFICGSDKAHKVWSHCWEINSCLHGPQFFWGGLKILFLTPFFSCLHGCIEFFLYKNRLYLIFHILISSQQISLQ